MRISLSAEAQTEAREATDWYLGEEAFAAADHFADELGHVLTLLSQFPELGQPGPYQTRKLPLHAFPYSLIYRVETETVRVIAIAHQRRRPGYWAGRR